MQLMINQINNKLEAHGYSLKEDQLDLLTIGDTNHEIIDEDGNPVGTKNIEINMLGKNHTVTPKHEDGIMICSKEISN